jgi:hypothetical protein
MRKAMTDSMRASARRETFYIKDCALVVLATGRKARLLQEFRSELAAVDAASIYQHFWGGMLQPRFEEREYNNDFASWVRHAVHDEVLAERLGALSPSEFTDFEALRREIIELIDSRLDEAEFLLWSRASSQFEFTSSQIVVFDAEKQIDSPEGLATALPAMSTSSVFYHFIDARRRSDSGLDDFSDWLGSYGDRYTDLSSELAGVDPYFGNLGELRTQLAHMFAAYFGVDGQ